MKTENRVKHYRRLNKSYKILVPENIRNNCKDNFLEIIIQASDEKIHLITSVNRKITIRKQVREQLHIGEGDVVEAEFNYVERAGRADKLFRNGKVDILSLIPENTSKGYDIIVSEFEKESEKFLRIWSPGGTKGARQIELKRFVDKRALGEILGQYQAEGEKVGKPSRIVFTNKLIQEHKDFIQNLEFFGLNKELISIQCVYNEEFTSKEKALLKCDDFEETVGVEVEKFVRYNRSRGPLAFRSKFYNLIFAEILFNALHVIREDISHGIEDRNKSLGQGFLAKLLTGDGTLDTTVSSSRTYGSPSINVKIVDQDLSALEDYKSILSNFGFQPFISKEHIYARSSCSLENLLFLYEIKAFKNTRNWQKLVITVMLVLKGRRYTTYKRFIDFLDSEKITSGKVAESYDVSRRAAQEWLENKCDEGLLQVDRRTPYPKIYDLTSKGKKLATNLVDISDFSKRIKKEKEVKSYEEALKALKDDIRA
jgi:hypothetical protein